MDSTDLLFFLALPLFLVFDFLLTFFLVVLMMLSVMIHDSLSLMGQKRARGARTQGIAFEDFQS